MASDRDMRLPYGPGWEDPDWTPQAPPDAAEEPAARAVTAPVDTPTRIHTLAQFMNVVKRHARPARAAPPVRSAPARAIMPAGQTRRWVVAGGASLLAVGSLALPRAGGHADAARGNVAGSGRDARTSVAERVGQDRDGDLPTRNNA